MHESQLPENVVAHPYRTVTQPAITRMFDQYEIDRRQNLLDKIEAITGRVDNLVYLETAGLETLLSCLKRK